MKELHNILEQVKKKIPLTDKEKIKYYVMTGKFDKLSPGGYNVAVFTWDADDFEAKLFSKKNKNGLNVESWSLIKFKNYFNENNIEYVYQFIDKDYLRDGLYSVKSWLKANKQHIKNK